MAAKQSGAGGTAAHPSSAPGGNGPAGSDSRARARREKLLRELAGDGMQLGFVPEDERDRELCTAALKQNGLALQYVPGAERDMYLCQKALRSAGRALAHVPDSLRSSSVCRLACRNDGLALEFVPAAVLDADLCRTALQQTGLALQYVPEAMMDEKLCRLAVRVDGQALAYVPEDRRSERICYEAVRCSGMALRHVPEALRGPLLTARARFSAAADVRRRTTVTYQAPPDWDDIRKTKPREEWGRYENWVVLAPEDTPFPGELALPPDVMMDCLKGLAARYVEAAGAGDWQADARALRPGTARWLEVPRGEHLPPWRVYAPGLRQLLSTGLNERGLPVTAGAFTAAVTLMDWAEGWSADEI